MPARKPIIAPETFIDMPFPLEGLDTSLAFSRQRKGTTPSAQNVRAFEPSTDRARGSTRGGLAKQVSGQVSGTNQIQTLDTVITPYLETVIQAGGQFVYAKTAANGFGLGTAAGSSYFTGGAVAGFTFANSCWDTNGFAYVVTQNATTATKIYKVDSSGAGSIIWTVVGPVVQTGASTNRAVAGMCVIGSFLYIAVIDNTGDRIYKVQTSDGAIVGGVAWQSNATVTDMVFSANSVNCLAAVGIYLGAACAATVATTNNFIIFNTLDGTNVSTGTDSTFNSSFCRVDSDGSQFFYAITGTNVTSIKKIDVSGNIIWSQAVGSTYTPTGLCYDRSGQRLLVAASAANPCVKVLSLVDGSQTTSFNPNGTTAWNTIDSDGNGNFVVYKNTVAASDIVGLNSNLAVVWGPGTFANISHNGASVNRVQFSRTNPALSPGRQRALAVSAGTIVRFDTGAIASVTNGASALSAAVKTIFAAQNGTGLYFVDGVNYKYYYPPTDNILAWPVSAGALPYDLFGNFARLICTWRGRTVLSGLTFDPQNWFMSAQGDPSDWDYSPQSTTPTQAVAGNNSPAGLVGDTINCLIPYNDDVMIFGGDHTIWLMNGDPMAGGQIDLVSDLVGMAWGKPFCKGPDGTLYFFATRGGVYRMVPGQQPVRISQQISDLLRDVDISTNSVRMAWDDRQQGLHVFLTPVAGAAATQHYFWEQRTNAWWPDVFSNNNHNPIAVCVFDGDAPNDRRTLIGSFDGYIRYLKDDAENDDGTIIQSSVVLGPLLTKDLDELLLKDLQAILSTDSADVNYQVLIGRSAEEALISLPVESGVWLAGRNMASFVRRSGYAIWVKLTCLGPWAMETVRARIAGLGKVRRRN